MYSLSKKLFTLFLVATLVVFTIALAGYCSCQKLGEYCGSPPNSTFPACCPLDTDSNGQQVPLECKNVDNGVGTCEPKDKGN